MPTEDRWQPAGDAAAAPAPSERAPEPEQQPQPEPSSKSGDAARLASVWVRPCRAPPCHYLFPDVLITTIDRSLNQRRTQPAAVHSASTAPTAGALTAAACASSCIAAAAAAATVAVALQRQRPACLEVSKAPPALCAACMPSGQGKGSFWGLAACKGTEHMQSQCDRQQTCKSTSRPR